MPTCLWTNETTDRAVSVTLDVPSATGGAGSPQTVHVLPEHEADLRSYTDRVARWGRPMLIGVLALSVAMLAVAFGGEIAGWSDRFIALVSGILVAFTGLVVVVLPFATPQTVSALGVQTSIRVARMAGFATAAIGLGIALWG